jgi:DUF917 family protein
MRKLTQQDLYDIILGCTVLGTGGGGDPEQGKQLIQKDIQAGREFKIINLDDVPDDALIGSPYMCGSISPTTEEEEKRYANLPRKDETEGYIAFKALQEYLGEKFYAALSTELGGFNTVVALTVAANAGIPIVDADPAGRSVPELQHSTFFMNKVSITPLAAANQFGDVVILKEAVNDFRAEAIVRSIAVVSKNSVGVTDHPVRGDVLKKSVIPGAISYAEIIGRALRQAQESGGDPSESIAKAGKGYKLFEGEVSDFDWATKDGFTIGEVAIDGNHDYAGKDLKIWFKNENIISWKNGKVFVTVPDLMVVLDKSSSLPVTNPNFAKGMEVSVIGLPAPGAWRVPEGIASFGPRHFGYDYDYVPIEDVVKKR